MRYIIFCCLVAATAACSSLGSSQKAVTMNQVIQIKKRQPIKVGDNYLELVSFSHKTALKGGPKQATATLIYSSSPTKQIDLIETVDASGKTTYSSAQLGKYTVKLLNMKYDESVQVDLIPK